VSEAAVTDLTGLTAAAEDRIGGDAEAAHCSVEEGCITCGDVAVPLRVLAIDAERELALCADQSDRRETVEIALVAPVAVGDELLVHAGTAIAKLADHPARDPAGADAGAQEKSPRRRRGQGVPAGAEQPAGAIP
jgi:hydrogenase assembly chaperone HypC/HupF